MGAHLFTVTWPVASNDKIKKASLPSIETSIESILLQVQLRWAGHVTRMEDVRMPKAVFFSNFRKESAIEVLQESVTNTN